MLISHLFPLEFEFAESQSGMLVLNPRYTSPIASSGAWYIYPKLIEVVAYYPELSEKQESVYKYEKLGGEE